MTPKQTNSMGNFLVLVIVLGGFRARLVYYPQSALATLASLRIQAMAQLDQLLSVEELQPASYYTSSENDITIEGRDEPVGQSDELVTSDSTTATSGSSIINQPGSDDLNTTLSTDTFLKGTTDIVSLPSSNDQTISGAVGTDNTMQIDSNESMSIIVGSKKITIDGTLQESIIINAQDYSLTIQNN